MLLSGRLARLRAFSMLCVLFPTSLWSQAGSSATVMGTVTYPSGDALAGATVTLKNLAVNTTRSAQSGNDGVYVFTDVPSSTYDLTVAAAGFETAKVEGIQVAPAAVRHVDTKLSLLTAGGPTPQEVTFVADSDNTVQKYLVLLPHDFDASGQHDLLIVLHGYGSDRWQFMKPTRDELRAAIDIAAKYKMIYVSPDYRGTNSWMGPRAEGDLTQIIEALKKQYRVGKVILSGGSMGGASSLTYAALHPEIIDGLASMNGTANYLEYEGFQDSIRASFGGSKEEIPSEYKLRSAEYWPERLTMPIALTLSGKDVTVPPNSVSRLAHILQTLHRRVLLIYRENEGHKTSYADAVAILEFAVEESHRN